MRVLLSICAYCEEATASLQYTAVGGRMVILCSRCRADRQPLTPAEVAEWLTAPVEVPPGLLAVEHHCPMLEYDGFDASITLPLALEGAYRRVRCPECGIVIRSAAPAVPGKK